MTTYLGYEVLDIVDPNRGDGTPWEWLRPMHVLDNRPGRSQHRPTFDGMRQQYQFDWICVSRAQKVQLRDWIDAHYGRRIPFWVPTYRRDMVLEQEVEAPADAFRIEPIRYALQVFPQGGQRHHVAFAVDGQRAAVFKEITVAAATSSYEELTVSETFAEDWPIATTIISFLMLVRLVDDDVPIFHRGPEFARATLPLIELPQEVP